MLPLSLALADELEIDVIAMGLIVTMACNLGCMSPISNGGIIAAGLIATLIFYVLYKMHRPKVKNLESLSNVKPFDKDQKLTKKTSEAV